MMSPKVAAAIRRAKRSAYANGGYGIGEDWAREGWGTPAPAGPSVDWTSIIEGIFGPPPHQPVAPRPMPVAAPTAPPVPMRAPTVPPMPMRAPMPVDLDKPALGRTTRINPMTGNQVGTGADISGARGLFDDVPMADENPFADLIPKTAASPSASDGPWTKYATAPEMPQRTAGLFDDVPFDDAPSSAGLFDDVPFDEVPSPADAADENPFADLIPPADGSPEPQSRIYRIELPDGRVMTASAYSEADALAGAQEWYAQQQQTAARAGAGEPIIVEGPGGVEVEFPAGTPVDVMNAAMRKHFGPSPAAGAQAASGLQGYREPRTGFSGWLKDQADVVAPLAQGVTGNYADELAAGAGAVGNRVMRAIGMDVPELDRATILRNIRRRQDEFAAENPNTAMAGEMIGSLAPAVGGGVAAARALPSVARRLAGLPGIVRAGLAGGAGGAAYEGVNRTGELRESTGIADLGRAAREGAVEGGIGGLVAGPAAHLAGSGIARVAGPWATAAAQRLHDRSIRLTPGQLVGGSGGNMVGRGIGALEQALTSIPIASATVRQQYRRSVDDLNRVALNDVLAPIGQQLHRGVRPGREAIQTAHDAISDAYEQVVPYLRANWSQPAVSTELARIRARVPQDLHGRFDDAIDRYLGRVANPMNGSLAGRDVQNALAGLSRDARGYATSPTALPHDRDLGEALGDVREMLIGNIEAHSPAEAWTAFRNTQRAFERLMRVEAAASSTASKQGVFGPSQLQQAVRSSDRSARRSRFARGTATLQNISDDAAAVMTRDLADSGSPERLGVMSLVSYGPTAATMNPAWLAGPAAVAAGYTTPAQWLARRAIAGGGRRRAAIRRAIERATGRGASRVGSVAGDEFGDE